MVDGTESLLAQWQGHPDALIAIIALQVAYLLGVGPLRERYRLADRVDPRQMLLFSTGVAVMLIAVASPLHTASEKYLFSAHMTQHVLLTLVAPPLLILGTPDWLVRPLIRPAWAYRLARVLVNPILAFTAFNLMFSLWHAPALYESAINVHAVHLVEHALMIGTATMMWWPLVSRVPELPRMPYPAQMIYLFGMTIAQIIVFGGLAFSAEPMYEFYENAPRIWNVTPLEDQQIGAVIMKVGGGLLFLCLLIIAFYRWSQEDARQNPAPGTPVNGHDRRRAEPGRLR